MKNMQLIDILAFNFSGSRWKEYFIGYDVSRFGVIKFEMWGCEVRQMERQKLVMSVTSILCNGF
jgi:hypothetical protein